MSNYIKGKISKILYLGNNGYTVGVFRVFETEDENLIDFVKRTITFTYTGIPLNKDLTYKFYGELIEHPRFGMQYKVNTAEIVEPDDLEGIILYLSSGLFRGIGLKTATNIVNTLGENAISLIREDKFNLSKVKGMSLKKIDSLYNELNNYYKDQELILELNNIGFSTKESLGIVNKHKDEIDNIMKNDIYILVGDVDFLKLDYIYLKSHEEKNPVRIKALIKYIINTLCYETGDTLVEKENVYLNIKKYFKEEFNLADFLFYLSELNKEGEVIIKNELITLRKFYQTEAEIAAHIKFLNLIKSKFTKEVIDENLEFIESNRNIKFDKIQKEAIRKSLMNNFFVITGGPGTGKTTIIRAVVDIYKKVSLDLLDEYNYLVAQKELNKIVLLAPTGRSAKRMTEAVNHTSSTIHKFLKWNKETSDFGLNENNKSDAKLVIVDEASMVDIFLFNSLLKALKDDVKLILVGDEFQLPSINPGNVLADLVSSELLEKTYLQKIYRTKENSYIPSLAAVIKGRDKFINDAKYEDFSFIESDDFSIKPYLEQIIKKYKDKNMNIDEFQVLAPMYKGENGIDNLNKLLQSIINPDDEEKNSIKIGNVIYREKDKVIHLVNDTDNNVFNGDIGYIESIRRMGNSDIVTIDFMGNIVEYKNEDFGNFTHAYAISIHKSQGSEYDNVVIILSSTFKRMFYNKLIYTAVTRAKRGLIIIGQEKSMNVSINSEYASNRISSLYSLINE